MKKLLIFASLLASVLVSAQQIKFQETTPYIEKAKDFQKKTISFKDNIGDLLVCNFLTYKPDVSLSEIVLLDKNLNIVQRIELQGEYKNYSTKYLGKFGKNYIISIYKGINPRFLGLLDENWKLVKTLPLQKGYVYETLLHADDKYAYVQVEGWNIIKIDEQLNVLQKQRTQEYINTYNNSFTTKVKDGKIYLRILGYSPAMYNQPSLTRFIYRFDQETLQETKIDMFEKDGTGDYQVYYGKDVIACVDYSHGRARILDYNGFQLQETTFPQIKDYSTKAEHTIQTHWLDSDELIIAHMPKMSQNNRTDITVIRLNRDGEQTVKLPNVEIAGKAQMTILDCENNDVRLFIGRENGFSVMAVNIPSGACRTLLEKPCNLAFEHAGTRKNDAGYILCTHRTEKTSVQNNDTYYKTDQAQIFITKDFSNATVYTARYDTKNGSSTDVIYNDSTYKDFALILHSEPVYDKKGKPTSAYEIRFHMIDKSGNRTTVASDMYYYMKNPLVFKCSSTEYFLYSLIHEDIYGKDNVHKAGLLKLMP